MAEKITAVTFQIIFQKLCLLGVMTIKPIKKQHMKKMFKKYQK